MPSIMSRYHSNFRAYLYNRLQLVDNSLRSTLIEISTKEIVSLQVLFQIWRGWNLIWENMLIINTFV
jgi:hypothetical protein